MEAIMGGQANLDHVSISGKQAGYADNTEKGSCFLHIVPNLCYVRVGALQASNMPLVWVTFFCPKIHR